MQTKSELHMREVPGVSAARQYAPQLRHASNNESETEMKRLVLCGAMFLSFVAASDLHAACSLRGCGMLRGVGRVVVATPRVVVSVRAARRAARMDRRAARYEAAYGAVQKGAVQKATAVQKGAVQKGAAQK